MTSQTLRKPTSYIFRIEIVMNDSVHVLYYFQKLFYLPSTQSFRFNFCIRWNRKCEESWVIKGRNVSTSVEYKRIKLFDTFCRMTLKQLTISLYLHIYLSEITFRFLMTDVKYFQIYFVLQQILPNISFYVSDQRLWF